MAVHPFHERLEPVPGHFDVAVDEDEIIGLHLLQGTVVAAGESVVLVQYDERDFREVLLHESYGIIHGGVVGHYYLCVQPFAGGDEPGQELLQVIPSVVV